MKAEVVLNCGCLWRCRVIIISLKENFSYINENRIMDTERANRCLAMNAATD